LSKTRETSSNGTGGQVADVDYVPNPRRWWALIVLSLSLVIIGMDNTILNVAIPTLQRTFDASSSTLQWMVDAYILVFAGLLLTMGGLGDRFGRKRILQLGLVIFTAGALAAAYAGSSNEVIWYRALMGIGGAMIMPSTLSIIIDQFKGQERAKAIATWTAVGGFGVGLGPLIGGLLLENFWWGSIFLVNVPIAVAALIAGFVLIPESKDPEPKPIDFPGALLSTAAVSLLVFSIIEAPSRGWLSTTVLGGIGISVLLSIGFAVWELKAEHPLLDFSFFKRPRFSIGAASISIAFFALMGMMFGLTQYLQFVKGFSALEAGAGLLPIAAGLAISARLSEKLVLRFGSRVVVSGGLLAFGITLTGISFYTVDTPYWQIAVITFFIAASMGNIIAPATDSIMGAVPGHKAGVGSAMNDVTRQVAGALGIAIIGSALNAVYSSSVADAVVGLPEKAAEAAQDSVGAAVAISAQMPGGSGDALALASRIAFVDALGVAVLIAAGVAVMGALIAWRYMPPRPLEFEPTSTASNVPITVGSD